MAIIGERLSSFIKISRWRKPKRNTDEKPRPRSVLDVTDIIRNIEGLESSYQSFDIDFQTEIPSIEAEKAQISRKSGKNKSWMSLMCGMHSNEADSKDRDVMKRKAPRTSTPEKRKSWMPLICGAKNIEFGIEPETTKPLNISTKTTSSNENRKSWMSFVCGIGNKERPSTTMESTCRDSGISLLSDENEGSHCNLLQPKTKHKSRSCDDILDSLRQMEDTNDSLIDESFDFVSPSMNNLFRTTSIQESAFKITHRRRQNIKRRRGNECYSCCSERDIQILKGSKSEGDLLNIDSVSEKEVRFSGHGDNLKGKSVSTAEMTQYSSRQLKSWQIRRQTRDQKNKLKRESRNLELLLSKDFEFQERFIM